MNHTLKGRSVNSSISSLYLKVDCPHLTMVQSNGGSPTAVLTMLIGLSLVLLALLIWRRQGRHVLGILLGIFLVLVGAFVVWVGSNLGGRGITLSEPTCQWSGSPVPGFPWCDEVPSVNGAVRSYPDSSPMTAP